MVLIFDGFLLQSLLMGVPSFTEFLDVVIRFPYSIFCFLFVFFPSFTEFLD